MTITKLFTCICGVIISFSQILSQTPHPAALFSLGDISLGDKNHPQPIIKLSDGSSLEVRISGLRESPRVGAVVFDKSELWWIPSEGTVGNPQLLFAKPSSWLEPKEMGCYGIVGVLDAKIRGGELEVLLCKSMEIPDMYMSMYRFQKTGGGWSFSTGVEIDGTDRIKHFRVKAATLEERGKIKLKWADGQEANMQVDDDGVVTLEGKVFWLHARLGKPPLPDMELEKEEHRHSFRAGNQILYPKLLREMGVIADESKPSTPSPQVDPSAVRNLPVTKSRPNKAADQAPVIQPAPSVSGISWGWWVASCVLIGAALLIIRSRRQNGA